MADVPFEMGIRDGLSKNMTLEKRRDGIREQSKEAKTSSKALRMR